MPIHSDRGPTARARAELMHRPMRLGVHDAGEILTLQRAAYVSEAQAHADPELPPLRQSLAKLQAELADPSVLALGYRDADGRLLAAARAHVDPGHPTVAEIGRLTVVPDRQGEGLGSRLLVAIEDAMPVTVTELQLFTGEHSKANLRLYLRQGYLEDRREPTAAGYALIHLRKRRRHTTGGVAIRGE